MKQQGDFSTIIAGVPCQIKIGRHGGSDISTDYEYEVLDRKGYRAKWLERKIDAKTDSRIGAEISSYNIAQSAEDRAYNRYLSRMER